MVSVALIVTVAGKLFTTPHEPVLEILATKGVLVPAIAKVVEPKVIEAVPKVLVIIAPPSLVAAIAVATLPAVPVPVLAAAHDQEPVLLTLATKAVLVPAKAKVVEPKVIEAVLK